VYFKGGNFDDNRDRYPTTYGNSPCCGVKCDFVNIVVSNSFSILYRQVEDVFNSYNDSARRTSSKCGVFRLNAKNNRLRLGVNRKCFSIKPTVVDKVDQ